MNSETVTIKALDGTAVFCQIGGCGRPARYLFSTRRPRNLSLTGRRAAKLKTMTADQLRQEQTARAWSLKRSGLSVEYACAAVDDARKTMVGAALGAAWAKLTSDKGKFQAAWKACWKGLKKGFSTSNRVRTANAAVWLLARGGF
jgi:hypothetical protein